MSRIGKGLFLVLGLGVLGAGCRFVSTPIGRILRAPAKYQGLEVTVEGQVEAVRWLPQTGATGFCLVEGPESLLVLTTGRAPLPGARARLRGTVSRRFPVEGRDRVALLYSGGPQEGESSGSPDTR